MPICPWKAHMRPKDFLPPWLLARTPNLLRADSPPPCGEGLGVGGLPTSEVGGSPPPCPSPTRGEGTLWRWRRLYSPPPCGEGLGVGGTPRAGFLRSHPPCLSPTTPASAPRATAR